MFDRAVTNERSQKILLDVLYGNSSKEIPVWIMRQAGRYLPEYRELRKKAKHFLDFCYTPSLATEATLQPLRRFDLDAAIIFSDILVIPDAMGITVSFKENVGPVLERKEHLQDYENLVFDPDYLSNVYEAIEQVKSSLPSEKTLIGFSGAPWTLMVYMLEGKSSKDFAEAKKLGFRHPRIIQSLLERLVEAIVSHLSQQIEAGADCVKIFDSWAGCVPDSRFNDWVVDPIKKIVSQVKELYPSVPVIVFPRGIGEKKYIDFVETVGADCVAIDQYSSMVSIRENVSGVLQGNVDPTLLFSSPEIITREVNTFLDSMEPYSFVCNLGHGVLPETPIEHVELLVKLVKERG